MKKQIETRVLKVLHEKAPGQSLVEFVLVMPIFVLMLLGGTYTAFNFYQANMASDAIRQTSLKKLEMANNPNLVNGGTLVGYINGGTTKGSMNLGPMVDSVNFAAGGDYATFVVGMKTTRGIMNIVPGMTIQVNQAINKNLLLPANAGGAITRPANTPFMPFGAPVPPPWGV